MSIMHQCKAGETREGTANARTCVAQRCTMVARVVILLYLLAPAASAQEVSTSLEELLHSANVEPGSVVDITDAAGLEVTGTVEDLSASALVIAMGRETLTFAESEISTISIRDPVSDGIRLGALVGAGAYLAICLPDERHFYTCAHLAGWGAAFAGIGALIGWSIDRGVREAVYGNLGSAHLTMSPLPSNEGMGIGMALSW